jgi:hypothetical protein
MPGNDLSDALAGQPGGGAATDARIGREARIDFPEIIGLPAHLSVGEGDMQGEGQHDDGDFCPGV